MRLSYLHDITLITCKRSGRAELYQFHIRAIVLLVKKNCMRVAINNDETIGKLISRASILEIIYVIQGLACSEIYINKGRPLISS